MLSAYVPFAFDILWNGAIHDTWDTERIHRLSLLYAIPDFVSLFLVERMGIPTIVHHCFVVMFCVYCVTHDFERTSLAHGVVVYACFSVFSYIVNLLLATRFLERTNLWMTRLALAVYSSCLICNWTWQIQFLHQRHAVDGGRVWVYVAMLGLVVYDDILLVTWLYRNSRLHSTLAEKAD
jgi:hypothetical protein